MRQRVGRLSIAWAVGAAAVAVLGAQSSAPVPWTPVTAERLLHPQPGDWMNYRRTYDAAAFSPLAQINRSNVGQLRSVWSYSVPDNSRWLPTPVVANGLMFVAGGDGRVLALDAVTGDVVWIHERKYPADIATSEAFGRARGVSVYGDKIYWGTADCEFLALDARTGRVVWAVKTCDYKQGEGHNHPPLIADGKIFLGQAGGDVTGAGQFRALDLETGKQLWTVHTAPRPGDPGYETWTKRDIPPLGAEPWNTASYDPELRLVYFSTGQPTPWAVTLRGPGDALFANSVLAVDAETGKIRWYFQLSPEDSWDRAAYESLLVDLVIDDKLRKALIQTGKIGWGVILDRETGEFLRSFKTAYDNVVTGWTPQGRPIINPAAQPHLEDVNSGKVFQVCPHLHGARNLQAASYSPRSRLYYLGINNSCMDAKVVSAEYTPGRRYFGITPTPTLAPGYDYVGEFIAIDPLTGTRRWTYRPPSGAAMSASALSTAGDIVFGGTADRMLFALNTESGERLWQTRLNGDVSGAPITFEIEGVQYLAVGAGGRAAPSTSFGPLTGVDIPRGSGAIWVFALPSAPSRTTHVSGAANRRVMRATSGTEAAPVAGGVPPPPASSARVAAAGAPAPTTPVGRAVLNATFSGAQVARGEQQFKRACAACHEISENTGAAFRRKWTGSSVDDIYRLISTTMPENNPGGLTPDDYVSIITFFLAQSGYAIGTESLPADRAILQKLRIE